MLKYDFHNVALSFLDTDIFWWGRRAESQNQSAVENVIQRLKRKALEASNKVTYT